MRGEFNKNRNKDLGVDADVAYEIEAEGEHFGYIFLKFIDSHVLAIEAVELLSEKEQLVETIIKAFMTYTKKEKLFVHGFEHLKDYVSEEIIIKNEVFGVIAMEMLQKRNPVPISCLNI